MIWASNFLLGMLISISQPIEQNPAADLTQLIDHHVVLIDQATPSQIDNVESGYASENGNFTFRQNPTRTPHCVNVELDAIRDLTLDWVFRTDQDTAKTAYGTWYGGTGWTGQPLYVEWTDQQVNEFRQKSPALTPNFSNQELIIGSLCAKLYFVDFQSGKISRTPLKVGNTIKGTPSLDPQFTSNLYVGHGVPKKSPFGLSVFNILTHREVYTMGRDHGAFRGWGAFDSSPIVVGQFLFWPGENGSLYKFTRQNGSVSLHSILRYRVGNSKLVGIENSLAVNGELGYFGDNGGNVLCVNLSTLNPVWHYFNHDDIDASIVVDTTEKQPYVYATCEVDKQGDEGFAYLTKLNATNGSQIWQHKELCYKKKFPNRKLDGGIFATPLLGSNDCGDLIFVNYAINGKGNPGEVIAINKLTGKVVYRVRTDNYLWSSPVSVCDKSGRMYLITGDVSGNLYLIEGRTGRLVVKKKVGTNFESSPIVVGQSVVIGSRGREIYKLTLR